MNRIALLLMFVVSAPSFAIAQRRVADPTPEDLAKIRAACPEKATAKPAKPRTNASPRI